ncbi:MAG: lysophospholipid acyltransferase family protein [Verrucomicrobiales bacterium]|nr:lysophospholipid acyltransferase family protein [Verrucomicrobiales bacterium]
MSLWKKVRYRIEWFALQSLYFSVPLLPRKMAHLLSKGLGSLAFLADKRGRTTAIENLTLIFGAERDPKAIRLLARDSYRCFAQTVIDQFWSSRLNAGNYEQFCTLVVDDPEAVEKALESGAIWVTPHYSNFEWIALMMGFRGYKFTIVAQDFRNPSLTETYKKNREVSGHEVIPQRGAIMRLLRNLKRGGHAAFLTDLTIRPSKPATIIECFGYKTCVTAIHAELMKRTGLPVIPGICIPQPDGNYLLRGFKALEFGPEDTEHSIAQACWDVFEPIIRENPAPWLWMYKHWRFLPQDHPNGKEGRYPSYARPHAGFDEVLVRVQSTKV